MSEGKSDKNCEVEKKWNFEFSEELLNRSSIYSPEPFELSEDKVIEIGDVFEINFNKEVRVIDDHDVQEEIYGSHFEKNIGYSNNQRKLISCITLFMSVDVILGRDIEYQSQFEEMFFPKIKSSRS